MSITLVRKDILADIPENTKTVIFHGCNCFHIMGAGIARYLREKFPEVYNADLRTVRGVKRKLGTYSVAVITGDLYILNCYTQFDLGKNGKPPVDYEAIRKCLRKAAKEFKGWYFRLPQIGCGLAGGEWSIVEKIYEEELKNCKFTVYCK